MKEVVAGIDIGGTNTVYGLVDKAGKIVAESSLNTTAYPYIEIFVRELVSSVKMLMTGKPDIKLIGIGIGAPMLTIIRGPSSWPLTWHGKELFLLPI